MKHVIIDIMIAEKKQLILIGYARSGLTVINRVLSSDERLICLSEINTKYLCPTLPNTPHEQVNNWYELTITKNTTIKEISEILDYCKKNNKTLILRDWSFGGFVPLKYNNLSPSNTLNTIDDIQKEFPNQFEVIALVRDPIDVWLSMNNSIKTFHDKELKFLWNFTNDLINRKIQYVKYEDFVKNTKKTLRKIYNLLSIKQPNKITLSDKAIGDIDYPESSRGAHLQVVKKLKRREISDETLQFIKEKTLANKISKLLNYPLI